MLLALPWISSARTTSAGLLNLLRVIGPGRPIPRRSPRRRRTRRRRRRGRRPARTSVGDGTAPAENTGAVLAKAAGRHARGGRRAALTKDLRTVPAESTRAALAKDPGTVPAENAGGTHEGSPDAARGEHAGGARAEPEGGYPRRTRGGAREGRAHGGGRRSPAALTGGVTSGVTGGALLMDGAHGGTSRGADAAVLHRSGPRPRRWRGRRERPARRAGNGRGRIGPRLPASYSGRFSFPPGTVPGGVSPDRLSVFAAVGGGAPGMALPAGDGRTSPARQARREPSRARGRQDGPSGSSPDPPPPLTVNPGGRTYWPPFCT